MARPSSFTQERADKICKRLAEGESLRAICSDKTMPARQTVFRWLEANEAFRDQYARARDQQHDYWADEILAIADTPQLGVRRERGTGAQGPIDKTIEADMIDHRRLQVDARKWLLSKLAPKKFGDRKILTGEDGPVVVQVVRFGEEGNAED